jgi:hypothetical protein
MGLLRSTVRSLGAAAAIICVFSLAGLGTSHAASSKASDTSHANGLPCGDLCKAYKAWSHRVMATFHQPQARAQLVAHKKPERTVHHASATNGLPLNVFAELPRRSEAAPQPVETETPQVQAAMPEPMQPFTQPPSSADAIVSPTPAVAGVATNASVETTPVLVADRVSAPQDTASQDTVPQDTGQDASPANRFTFGLDGRFVLSLALALCALLSLLAWVCFRGWTQTPDTIR